MREPVKKLLELKHLHGEKVAIVDSFGTKIPVKHYRSNNNKLTEDGVNWVYFVDTDCKNPLSYSYDECHFYEYQVFDNYLDLLEFAFKDCSLRYQVYPPLKPLAQLNEDVYNLLKDCYTLQGRYEKD